MKTQWRKSSRSQGNGGACVEARRSDVNQQIRDSKLGNASPVFSMTVEDFGCLLRAARR
ncbi:DUF397 domain-containing protein [Natronoglycomyces albus]|uniref:DUF397 domain-containing protein n=1 Tax=Natronoglycomyces albus TaxID=2811108 RepID=A0A895XUT9_9ACTN|nr:DUF397 domain-containing protein [Natronoglycomyces albus]QSB05990.1 DUF397 domain-containing protein [Natronoglycomyces albus]